MSYVIPKYDGEMALDKYFSLSKEINKRKKNDQSLTCSNLTRQTPLSKGQEYYPLDLQKAAGRRFLYPIDGSMPGLGQIHLMLGEDNGSPFSSFWKQRL